MRLSIVIDDKILIRICLFIIITLMLSCINATAQNYTVQGKITDSSNRPLEGANIIALPDKATFSPKFTITNHKGLFSLDLEESSYQLKISYLGLVTQTVAVSKESPTPVTVVLEQNTSELDEVVLNYIPEPIQVKKDGIVFNVKDFTDGSEYKLVDILKNLPGVEYDNGILTINGKEVTQAQIGGEKFFSGNTALAVDNIPADVVKNIEFIDDYSDVGFLKNISNEDRTIMNIKLKDPNASFSFGDLEAKYGNSNYYAVNPSFFNYSKKRSIAILGGSNNMGNPHRNIFSLESMDGGGHLIRSQINSGLGRFNFPTREVKNIADHALAVGYKNKLTPKTTLNTFIIRQKDRKERETWMRNQYLNPLNPRIETRSQDHNEKRGLYLGNLELISKISKNEEVRYTFKFENTNNHSFTDIDTSVEQDTTYLDMISDQGKLQLSNWFGWYRKFTDSFIVAFEATLSNLGDEKDDGYFSDDLWFDRIFTVDNNLQQNTFRDLTIYQINTKLNKTINLDHTLSLGIGMDAITDQFKSIIYEQSSDSISMFESFDISASEMEFFLKPGYLFKKDKYIAEAAVEIRNRRLSNQNNTWIAPYLNLKYKKSIGTEVSITYEYQDKLSSIYYRYPLPTGVVQSFNTILYPNEELLSNRYHRVNLAGGYANIFKGFTAYGSIDFKKYDRSVIYQVEYLDQLQLLTPINIFSGKNEINSRISVGKNFKKFKLRFTPRFKHTVAPQLSNGLESKTTLNDVSLRIGGETKFDSLPNIIISYARGFRDFKTPYIHSTYYSDQVSITLSKSKGAFKYKLMYDYRRISDAFQNDFSDLSFEMSYDFGKSPWQIELSGHNLLNTSVSSQNFITNIYISERETRILPAMVLLGVVYKI